MSRLLKGERFPVYRNPEGEVEDEEEEEEDLSSDESFSSKNIDSENSSPHYDDEYRGDSSTPTPTTSTTAISTATTTTESTTSSTTSSESSWISQNNSKQQQTSVYSDENYDYIESDDSDTNSDCDTSSSANTRGQRKREKEGEQSSFYSSVSSPHYSNQQSSSSIRRGQTLDSTTATANFKQHNNHNSSSINNECEREEAKSNILIKSNSSSRHRNSNNKTEHNKKKSFSKTTRNFLLYPFCLGEHRYLKKMYNFSVKHHKEICVVLFLLASGLPFLRSKPLKTRSVGTPGPFFDKLSGDNLVEDHYQGEYVDLVQKKIPLAPSFVFYYAPWDSESLAAKTVFLDIARHFRLTRGDQIKFYAVNCWWPDGQCRQNYKNLSHYPIFVAHIQGSAGIIYNGPIRAELMIRFLNLILRPVTRIDTEDELWRFRAEHDAVMLAFFNFTMTDSAAAYDIYLQMALRNLEADPLGQVGYGVFLRQNLADKYFVTSSNSISLVLFNEIHTAKWHGGFPSQDMRAPVKQVADWVIERTSTTPMTWAYRVRNGFSNRPVSLGPIDLAEELSAGPVLLLITRRYYPSAYSPFYAQVKEVALDYFNCNSSGNVTRLRKFTHKINAEWLKLWKSIQRICAASKNTSFNCDIMKEQLKHWKNSEIHLKREPLAEYERIVGGLNFTGLSCRSKKPFRFIAIDPADIPHFIELALGGVSPRALTLTDQEPLGFLVDAKNNLLVPIESFKPSDVAEQIYNYTISIQSENPQNHSHSLQHTSRLWIEEKQNDKKSKENRATNDIDNKKTHKDIFIEKLNAEDVLNILNEEPNPERPPIFLMFTARFCGYCGIALSQFVSLARFLGEYDLNIRLARVDVFRNSLPSHLTLGEIPSFLLFPAHNRSDVRIFPPGEEINIKNLLKFLLSELDSKTRIELSLKSPLCINSEESSDHTISNLRLLSHLNDNKRNNDDTCEENCSDSKQSSDGKRTRGGSNEELLLSGREYCQNTNKKLVNKQIESILRVLKSHVGVSSGATPKFTGNETQDNQTHSNNSKSNDNGNQNSITKSLNYNYDKLYFMAQLQHQNGDTIEKYSSSSSYSKIDSTFSKYYRNINANRFGFNSSNNNESESSLISFELESRHAWIIQLLDHLKRIRLYLDVM